MASQDHAFQGSLFPQLPMLSQREVVEALEPHFDILADAIMDPWEDFLSRRAEDRYFRHMNEDETGVWLTMQAAHRIRMLDDYRGFKVVELHHKPVLVYEDRLAIVIKKLTHRRQKSGKWALVRSNYLTERNKDFWDQRRTGNTPDMPRVILGYELIKEVTDIRLLLAYPRSRGYRVEWAYRIEPPTAQTLPLPRPVTPPAGPAVEDGRGFTIEKREDAGQIKERKGSDAG